VGGAGAEVFVAGACVGVAVAVAGTAVGTLVGGVVAVAGRSVAVASGVAVGSSVGVIVGVLVRLGAVVQVATIVTLRWGVGVGAFPVGVGPRAARRKKPRA
jgi:hypothetical protein